MFDDVKHVKGMVARMKPGGCLRRDPLEDDWVQFGLWVSWYDAPKERLEMREDKAAPVDEAISGMVTAGELIEVEKGRQWERRSDDGKGDEAPDPMVPDAVCAGPSSTSPAIRP
ncbi:hypothetical protein [Methylobacterium sp. WSM2598]|uniref:hypothetical protein n=1 Tax=Methylobacterium sp. WSM2598 TaxID=398261 RepID=UPI0003A0BEF5|nr:hypothetical protein [Methylobacterium sp. WSM2598]